MPQQYQLSTGIGHPVAMTYRPAYRPTEAVSLCTLQPAEGKLPKNEKASRLGGFFKNQSDLCLIRLAPNHHWLLYEELNQYQANNNGDGKQ